VTPQRLIVGRLADNSCKEIATHPRNSSSRLMMDRVCETKAQGLEATAVAKVLGIGQASVYRVLY